MQKEHPDVDIYIGALDEKLNEHKYIIPGDVYKRQGNVCIVVDMELKGRIREALIKMMLDFDIPLETEE